MQVPPRIKRECAHRVGPWRPCQVMGSRQVPVLPGVDAGHIRHVAGARNMQGFARPLGSRSLLQVAGELVQFVRSVMRSQLVVHRAVPRRFDEWRSRRRA